MIEPAPSVHQGIWTAISQQPLEAAAGTVRTDWDTRVLGDLVSFRAATNTHDLTGRRGAGLSIGILNGVGSGVRKGGVT